MQTHRPTLSERVQEAVFASCLTPALTLPRSRKGGKPHTKRSTTPSPARAGEGQGGGQGFFNTLSVITTTFNEEDHIGECLDSVSWAFERIVVDGESSDRTRDIAEAHGATVFVQPNHPMLNYNKNFGIDQARGDWIMSLDSDERVTPELRDEILTALSSSTDEGYRLPLRNYFWGKELRRAGGYPRVVTRICRRGKGRFGTDYVHQGLTFEGAAATLTSPLLHYPARNLYELIAKLNFNTTMTAHHFNHQEKKGSLFRACLYPPADFVWRYLVRGAFLDGAAGFALCAVRAVYMFTWQMKLWELQKVGTPRTGQGTHASLPKLG